MKRIGAVLITIIMSMPVFGAFTKNDRGTAVRNF